MHNDMVHTQLHRSTVLRRVTEESNKEANPGKNDPAKDEAVDAE